MVRCLLICAFLAYSTTGCFVVEELDRGMKFMEEHTAPEPEPEETEEAPKAAAKSGSDYWQNSRTISPGAGGNSNVVSCNLRGQVQFMKRDDCTNRGGTPK